jgi:hypothetical protein
MSQLAGRDNDLAPQAHERESHGMAYSIRAVIGRREAIFLLRPYTGVRVVALADVNFALVPITDGLLEALNEGAAVTPDPSDAFEYLSAPVVAWIAEGSRGGRLAYVEAEYFGGTGAQAAIGFDGGTVTLAAKRSEDVGPINSALHFLGVARASTQDEFETVGLAHHRRLEDWK